MIELHHIRDEWVVLEINTRRLIKFDDHNKAMEFIKQYIINYKQKIAETAAAQGLPQCPTTPENSGFG